MDDQNQSISAFAKAFKEAAFFVGAGTTFPTLAIVASTVEPGTPLTFAALGSSILAGVFTYAGCIEFGNSLENSVSSNSNGSVATSTKLEP